MAILFGILFVLFSAPDYAYAEKVHLVRLAQVVEQPDDSLLFVGMVVRNFYRAGPEGTHDVVFFKVHPDRNSPKKFRLDTRFGRGGVLYYSREGSEVNYASDVVAGADGEYFALIDTRASIRTYIVSTDKKLEEVHLGQPSMDDNHYLVLKISAQGRILKEILLDHIDFPAQSLSSGIGIPVTSQNTPIHLHVTAENRVRVVVQREDPPKDHMRNLSYWLWNVEPGAEPTPLPRIIGHHSIDFDVSRGSPTLEILSRSGVWRLESGEPRLGAIPSDIYFRSGDGDGRGNYYIHAKTKRKDHRIFSFRWDGKARNLQLVEEQTLAALGLHEPGLTRDGLLTVPIRAITAGKQGSVLVVGHGKARGKPLVILRKTDKGHETVLVSGEFGPVISCARILSKI